MGKAYNISHIDLMFSIALFPISHIEFFHEDLFDVSKNNKESYNDIFSKIYPILNRTSIIDSLDEVNLMFKQFYPEKENKNNISKCYIELLKEFAVSFISHRDGRLTFKYWSGKKEKYFEAYEGINKVLLWNSLSRSFPTDILGVLYILKNDMKDIRYLNGFYSQIALEDMQLEGVLKKGTAETHLHISASTDFYTSWKNLMDLYNKDSNIPLYEQVIGNINNLDRYRKISAIFRLLMSDFLQDKKDDFDSYLDNLIYDIRLEKNGDEGNKWIKETKEIYFGNPKLKFFLDYGRHFEKGFYDKFTSEELTKFFCILIEDILDIDMKLTEGSDGLEKERKDILDYIFFSGNENKKSDIKTYTENIFLMEGIKYMEEKPEDREFSKYFFNYIKVKNEFFNMMVQGNKIKGLDNFVNFFKRSTKLGRSSNATILWEERLRTQFKDKNLKKFEIRISPASEKNKNKTKKAMKKELIKILSAYRDIIDSELDKYMNKYEKSFIDDFELKEAWKVQKLSLNIDIPKLGIIYHFIKSKDKHGVNKCWQRRLEDEYSKEFISFEELHKKYKMQSDIIVELRKEIDGLSNYIVGIDGASIENYTEPWVFAPIYDSIRNSNNALFNLDHDESVKSLGFTFHAGEDFRHLLTGLRRISETVEHFKYHAGDRIGHGIALGIDVKEWRASHPVVIIPRMEYLENLIWIWGSYKSLSTSLDIGYLERRILDFAKDIYEKMEGITVFRLWEMYRSKFEKFEPEKGLKLDSIPDCDNLCLNEENLECKSIMCFTDSKGEFWNKDLLKASYHCKRYLEKMEEPIQVEVQPEKVLIIEEMQKMVAANVSRAGIVVETNPSSNAALGEIKNIFDHYITNLNKIDYNSNTCGDNDLLMISINTDDPSVFNSNLSNEFAYIFYSLVNQGYPKELVLKWIDKIREHGMNSSFVADRNMTPFEMKLELENIIHQLKKG